MIPKLLKPLFSNKLTLVLLFAYAGAMACATFLENDFGTQAVQSLVYSAWWFEAIHALLALNFIANIWKYKLYRKEKLSVLIFHLAFVVILAGAIITRYISFEGIMLIREGETSNQIVSQARFLKIKVEKNGKEEIFEKQLDLSYFQQPNMVVSMGDKNEIEIKPVVFVPKAEQQVVDSPNGTVLKVVVSSTKGQKDLFLASGSVILVNNFPVSFNRPMNNAINIYSVGNQLKINSPFEMNYMVMATKSTGILPADSLMPLQTRALYRSDAVTFVVPKVYENSAVVYRQTNNIEKGKQLDDLLFVKLNAKNHTKEILLKAFDGNVSQTQHFEFGDYHLALNYGPTTIELPFAIELKDFVLDRYPGSSSPSSFASEVYVVDGETSFPYKIFMNNVLNYKGYRLFQASYLPDEHGTILSVNHDFWGTNVTYLGYLLMSLAMMLTLFGKHSRFRIINQKLRELHTKKTALGILLLLSGYALQAQGLSKFDFNQSLLINQIEEQHATAFGKLLTQDKGGRIKPINTLSSKFLRKIHGKSTFQINDKNNKVKLNSDQVFLMMHINPLVWQQVPIIQVHKDAGTRLLKVLNKKGHKYLSFLDCIDTSGNYLLAHLAEIAYAKKPIEQNVYDKELLKVDERFNILFQGLTGKYLKIFPKNNDSNNTWYNDKFEKNVFHGEDSLYVQKILPMYYQSVHAATQSKDWSQPNKVLGYIKKYQNVRGAEVIPSDSVLQAELLYNKLKLFNKFYYLWLIGILALVVAIIQVFQRDKKWLSHTKLVLTSLSFVCFLGMTFNLALRWYASGHAPWSNGYEMIILVAWALLLFGIVFYQKSNFSLPLALLFSGTLLFVAFLDWLNPELTNLVPVLKSYWLKIHVAIIVSSYAPLGLAAMLGLMSLIFTIVDKGTNPNIANSRKEMTYISELAMTIGVFLLTIGTFLGGVWANESWGRYWGWDPKETWALISVIVYVFVLHLRLVPKLNNPYVFNVASLIAFFSIIMTSFGVNYYLSGLHSYAKGDPVPVPQFVYWIVASVALLCIVAYFAQKNKPLKKHLT